LGEFISCIEKAILSLPAGDFFIFASGLSREYRLSVEQYCRGLSLRLKKINGLIQ
jgi:hypothetical protein